MTEDAEKQAERLLVVHSENAYNRGFYEAMCNCAETSKRGFHSREARKYSDREQETKESVLAIVRNQASENERLNRMWNDLKAFVQGRSLDFGADPLRAVDVEYKMNNLEAKEK